MARRNFASAYRGIKDFRIWWLGFVLIIWRSTLLRLVALSASGVGNLGLVALEHALPTP